MIRVNTISKEFSGRILFSEVSFSINSNEKIGFVGRNGAGKSTLFKILTSELGFDGGEIIRGKNYSIGELKQHLSFSKKTILDECAQALKEEEKYDTFKVEKILSGLGFSPEDFNKDPLSFSGGYQIRLNLAKLFIAAPDLLLLDEPTNYLDVVSMSWLKNYLRKYDGEFVLITHDRDFMRAVCNTTMGIARQKIVKVKGSVDKYLAKISEEEEVYENIRLNQEKKKKEIEAFVNKFRAKARQASLAQSRMKMLEKMEEFDKLENISDLNFKFHYKPIGAKTLLTVKNLGFGYEESNLLFSDLSFTIGQGEKLAVIGKNGKGKSTLLNLLNQNLAPLSGEVQLHPELSIGHFGQTNINRLNDEISIEEEIIRENTDLSKTQVRNICASMMFSGDDAEKKINVLSGGEKSRVLLGKILANKSNLLLLDEPTNHLDQESVEALINELNAFKGGVVIVTHNERILRSLPTKFVIFHQDNTMEFLGSYDEFLEKVGWGDEEVENEDVSTSKLSKKEYNVQRQELIKRRSKILSPLKKLAQNLEDKITSLEQRVILLNDLLIEASTNEDGASITKASIELSECEAKIELSFDELTSCEDKILSFEKEYQVKLDHLETLT